MLRIILLIIVSLTITSCKQENSQNRVSQTIEGTITVLNANQFKEKIVGNQLIDIRTPKEFSEGYIDKAVNINMMDRSFLDEIQKLDKSKPVYIYCRSGSRSSYASKKIRSVGFKEVYDLKGGINSWTRSGYQIKK